VAPHTVEHHYTHAYTGRDRTSLMDKRTLAKNLALVGLAFVAVFHTVLSFYFETDLTIVGVAVLIVVGVGLLVVNL